MSNIIENPFIISGYESPEYFCDRNNEAGEIMDALRNGRNITLTSPRRMGKTGLILHIFNLLKKIDSKTVTIYLDIFSTENLADFTEAFATAVLGQLDSKPLKVMKTASSIIRGLRPNLTVDEFTGLPKIGVDIVAGEEENTLGQVFQYLKKSEKTCYVAFDEFQQIATYPEKNVEATLRSYIQNIHNVHFIFSGSQSHLLREMFNSPKKPFYQSTSSQTIGPIAPDEYFSFAEKFFVQQKRELPEEVFNYVYDRYDGYTWYIQMVMNRIYGKSGRKIDLALVQECISDILKENEYYYQSLLKTYSSGQSKLIKAIACEGKVRELTAGAFIAKYKLSAASSVKSSLKKILADEVVYDTDAGYMIYDRFFGEWLRYVFG